MAKLIVCVYNITVTGRSVPLLTLYEIVELQIFRYFSIISSQILKAMKTKEGAFGKVIFFGFGGSTKLLGGGAKHI